MPVSYPVPSWLHAPENIAGEYAAGAHLGAKIAMEKQRAQQDQQLAGMEAQVKQQQLEERSRQQQQELQVDAAYKNQQIALRQKSLDVAQQQAALKTQAAARKFAAQQKYQAMIEAGEDPDKAAMAIGPELFNSTAGLATSAREIYKRSHPFVPTSMNVDGQKMIQLSPNRWSAAKAGPGEAAPLQLQPIIGPNGKPVAGAGAYQSGTGGMHPFIFPKNVDPNAKEIKDLESGPYGDYLTGRRPEPKKPSTSYLATKKRYQDLKASKESDSGGKRFKWNPATKKIEPVAVSSPAHTEAGDTADVADEEY